MEQQQRENDNYIIPKEYAYANRELGQEWWDYDSLDIVYGKVDFYQAIKKIGRGKYSEVFEGLNSLNNQQCVLKVLKPIRKKKIQREIKILQNLSGGPNIIQLYDIVRDVDKKTTTLVFEHVNNVDYREIYPSFTDMDIRYYLYQLLMTLDFVHSKGIIHRDVKPHNVMIDHKQKKLRLIDWGLAEFYHPDRDLNVRVASRYYKGPELLIDYTEYDYSLDIWSTGCMMAGMIFQVDTFFKGTSNEDQLDKIAKVLGTEDLLKYIQKYGCELDEKYDGILGNHKKKSFKSFVTKQNQHLAHDLALDLLSKMLVYENLERITPKEALLHPYFEPIRIQLGHDKSIQIMQSQQQQQQQKPQQQNIKVQKN